MEEVMEYYLGLDMGTNSVGWAVTDKSYKLVRLKGKDLWGVRLFPKAETSANRRGFRISRRRRQRERARIELLNHYFEDEINKVDKNFLYRLHDSGLNLDDKRDESNNSLFNDKLFTDKEYYKTYPTIFHLRKHLINSQEKSDIRLIYLALLNMFKHRGHFLNYNLEASNSLATNTLIDNLMTQLEENCDLNIDISSNKELIQETLKDGKLTRSQKAEEIARLCYLSKTKEKQKYEFIKAICGLSIKLDVLLNVEVVTEDNKKIAFSFDDKDYDEKYIEFSQLIEDDHLEIIDTLKSLHDGIMLEMIIGKHRFLSEARVSMYEKHKHDLKILKALFNKYASSETYNDMFRNDVAGSYSAYVNSSNHDKKKRRGFKGSSKLDLYTTLKKELQNMPENDELVQWVKTEIEREAFLPKQLTISNGVIPNQIHANEMQVILSNAEKHYPFLLEKDDSDLTVSDRILQLFSFQIPYYIGPLNTQHSGKNGNAWVVRKESGKVLPWNFEEKIDFQGSSEAFIKNMVRKCSYISGESVLPKSSLKYEKFMVLNELNKIKIRENPIDVSLKQAIYNDLFLKGKRVTYKGLHQYLVRKGIVNPDEVNVISGLDGDFKNSLKSYGLFMQVLKDELKKDIIVQMVEKIIFWGTIYGDDKSFYKEKIKETYGHILSDEQLKRILGFKFKDWGNLSKSLLELTGINKESGEELPLIQAMWENNLNLNELLSERFTYVDTLNQQTKAFEKALNEITYSDLDGYYLSTAVKRMIWQTLLIVKELEEALGGPPKRLFIEMARQHDEKKLRKKSRKDQLMSLYKSIDSEEKMWLKQLKNVENDALAVKKIYLYYLQKGRCMYTGEPIEFDHLMNQNMYDIDHIYPRHFLKDDSIHNNLVLVKKELNAHKKDNYPIENSIVEKQKEFWKSLLSPQMTDRLITREKYNRLINRESFTNEQLAGFINRQLVETRQGTKAITKIFNEALDNTEVIFVKASLISDFRHKFSVLKSRSLNDFHHSQDAYLNIVVGNGYFVKFTKNPMNFIKDREKNPLQNQYHMEKIFDYTIKRGDEIAWNVKSSNCQQGTIGLVKNTLKRNTPLITKMVYEGHGELYNATIISASKTKEGIHVPIKMKEPYNNMKKYGGYNSISIAYFFLVEHDSKGKRIRTLEAIPIMDASITRKNDDELLEYCRVKLKLANPKILVNKILINSLVRKDGFNLNLMGKSLERLIVSNAIPLVLNNEWALYIKKIEKFISNQSIDRTLKGEKNLELYNILVDKHVNKIFKKRPNSIGRFLEEQTDLFVRLSLEDQLIVLNQILLATNLASSTIDLRLIGGSKNQGKSRISKKISDSSEFKLIHQSPTGLFTKEIDFLKL